MRVFIRVQNSSFRFLTVEGIRCCPDRVGSFNNPILACLGK